MVLMLEAYAIRLNKLSFAYNSGQITNARLKGELKGVVKELQNLIRAI